MTIEEMEMKDAADHDAHRYGWLRNLGNLAAVNALLDTTEINTLDDAIDYLMDKKIAEIFEIPPPETPKLKPPPPGRSQP